MAPYYTLAVDITIKGNKDADDVTVRLLKLTPFIPATGQVMEIWHDDSEGGEEETHRVELVNTFYSFQHSMFIEEQEDHSLIDAHRDGTYRASDLRDLITWYERFGFLRLGYPTIQVHGK